MVGRDVPGAPCPRGCHGDAHRHAGRRDVGPYHAHMGLASATAPHGRARRPRRAAPTGTSRGRPQARGPPGRRPLPRTHTWCRPLPRTTWEGATSSARRANGDVTGTPTGTRAAGTSAPTTHTWYWPLPRHHMVGRDVLGAPCPRGRPRERPQARGPPGRRPLPRTHGSGPCHAPHGRARRPRRAVPTGTSRGRPQARGPPGRRPLPCTHGAGLCHGTTW